LGEAGVAYETVCTEHPGHARVLARQATAFDTVIAVGGDGTINGVLDGLLQAAVSGQRMGVLYAGTSPDFCRFHGIPTAPEPAMRTLLAARVRRVDSVEIVFHSSEGQKQRAHFGCSCNVGLGPAIADFSNRIRPFFGDICGTGLAALRAFVRCKPKELTLELGNATVSLERVNNLSVMKNPYLASGLRLELDLQPDDGQLEVVGVHGRSRLGLLRLLPSFYTGKATRRQDLYRAVTDRIEIRARERCGIEFDGDPRGFLPARIRLKPKSLNLIC
jgi:diacylglycerol kinase family enzyme